jgi:hypothetical protein
MSIEKTLSQRRAPVFTVTSLVVTLLVEAVVVAECSHPGDEWAKMGTGIITLFAMSVGAFVNVIVGVVAFARRENWGFLIAVTGIALWVVTVWGITKLWY